jgi:conjugal transfer/type IV secretion protein DotA/TraY
MPTNTLPDTGEAGNALGFTDYGDQSVAIFNKIFGEGWDELSTGGIISVEPTIIMSILGMLNSVVMMGTSIIITYMLLIGVMGTANDGQPLGRTYSTLYTPLRMAFSVALLAPIPGAGISMLQAMLLAMTYFGFGAANHITYVATEYINNNHGSVYAIKSPNAYGKEMKRAILEGFMVQHFQTDDLSTAINSGSAVSIMFERQSMLSGRSSIHSNRKEPGAWVIRFNKSSADVFKPINADDLGMIRIGCEDKNSATCQGKINGVVDAINDLQVVARRLYRDNIFDSHSFTIADSALQNSARTLREDFNSRETPAYKQKVQLITNAISDGGWITLGQYSWVIAQVSEEATKEFALNLEVKRPNFTKIYHAVNDPILEGKLERVEKAISDHALSPSQIAERANRATVYTQWDENGNPIVSGAGTADVEFPTALTRTEIAHLADSNSGSLIDTLMNKAGRYIAFTVLDTVVGNEHDPVTSLANTGHAMILTGEAMAALGTTIDVTGKGIANATGEVAGGFWGTVANGLTGGTSSAALGFLQGFLAAIVSKIFMMFASGGILMIASGAGLAFYLPLVPFIMYTLAVIGVFILILESLTAAPLWASAIAMPHGEGMLGDHGKQGFMLFAGVVFRPPLLVTGFFISWLLMSAVGSWVLSGFKVAFTGITNNHSVGIVTILSIIFITSIVMITVSHKIFGLITWLPNNVMRWMGQQMHDLGENRESEAVGGKFAALITNTTSAAQKGMQAQVPSNNGISPKNKAHQVGSVE